VGIGVDDCREVGFLGANAGAALVEHASRPASRPAAEACTGNLPPFTCFQNTNDWRVEGSPYRRNLGTGLLGSASDRVQGTQMLEFVVSSCWLRRLVVCSSRSTSVGTNTS
jgi:hypothetical protein